MNCQQRGRVVFQNLQYVDIDKKTFDNFRLEDDDLLFNRTNSYELVGRTALFRGNKPAVFASYLIRLRVDRSKVDPIFLNFLLNWSSTQNELKALASRGVSQSNISASKLKDLTVLLPPLEEQRVIGALLWKIQDLREVQRAITLTRKEMKAAIMAELFREGVRGLPRAETEIGELPESWTVTPLGQICDIRSGGTPSRVESTYWSGDIPWVKTGEVNYNVILNTEETISQAGLENSSAQIFPSGTVIMAMYGQGVTRGRVARLGIPAATNQACAAFFCGERIDAEYLYAYFAHAYERLRSVGHGANQKNLSADILRGFPVALSNDIEEQREIATKVKIMDKSIEAEQRRLDLLTELFGATLERLMSGELDVAPIVGSLPEESSARSAGDVRRNGYSGVTSPTSGFKGGFA